MTTIYDYTALSNKGKEVSMADYRGKVLLIVNSSGIRSLARMNK